MATSALTTAVDEQARLHELHELQILDTSAEERFDQYTRLVSDVLKAPIVLVSLVDAQRQWFKSAVGLDATETGRNASFCAHALPVEFLEVPDTRKDCRFSDNVLVTGPPFIRFYAGAVLHGPTGQPLGTLCVIDSRPRRLSTTEKNRLIAFASLVEQELNLHQRFDALERKLTHAAFYEPVTGLPGNDLIEARLTRCLKEAQKQRQGLAVMQIQLADLEMLTTLDGQAGVDTIMQRMAQRLRQCIRPVDEIGRLDSKRFVVILPGWKGPEKLADERIREMLREVAAAGQIGPEYRRIKLAAGVSRYPDDAATASGLLDCARVALCHRSTVGSASALNFYSSEAHALASQRHEKLQRLSDALDSQRLRQVYQPIVDCHGGRIVAVEALARWHDDLYGEVSPGEFIPLIESEADLRRALTQWSLSAACRQIADWQRLERRDLSVTVNIPGEELYQNGFVDRVRAVMAQYDVSPHHLVLELTEQSLIADVDAAAATIQSLRALGTRFAIDDFGTGYSSLNYLKRLQLDTIKIDRSFIRDIVTDPTTRELTRVILDIARTLRLSVVAEGIETVAQHRLLRELACPYVQGFLFGRPESADAIAFD